MPTSTSHRPPKGKTLTVQEAAARAKVSEGMIYFWRRYHGLTAVSEKPFRFRLEDVDRLAREAPERRSKALAEAARKSWSKRRPPLPEGWAYVADAARSEGVSENAIRAALGTEADCESPYMTIRIEDVLRLKQEMAERLDAARRANLAKAHTVCRETLWTRPPGTVSPAQAGSLLNLDSTTIRKLHKDGDLKAACERPLSFYPDAVKLAVLEPVRDGEDVPLTQLVNRIDGPDSRAKKLARVRGVVNVLCIPTYLRTGSYTTRNRKRGDERDDDQLDGLPGSVKKRRVRRPLSCIAAEHVERVLSHVTNAGDPQRDDEQTLSEWARELGWAACQLKPLMQAYAPDSGRQIERRKRRGLRKATVYPRAAVEAALRGETWTPPANDPAPRTADAASSPAAATASDPPAGNGEVYAPPTATPAAEAVRPTRVEWLAKAMLLVRDHPDWSDRKIAGDVGVHPGTLSRSKEYQAAAALSRRQKTDLPRGHVHINGDNLRHVEAYSDRDDPAKMDWD